MDNSVEVIGVDIGNGFTKTVHTCFLSGVCKKGEAKPALEKNLVGYNGQYYCVGTSDRTTKKTSSKEMNDESFFVLALAGIAEELRLRGKHESRIILSEGLPLEYCTDEEKAFDIAYYKKGSTIEFSYENEDFRIIIEDVLVNPQCVSAILDQLADKTLPEYCVLVDIGTWTMDFIPMENHVLQGSKAQSLHNGVVKCIDACKDAIKTRSKATVWDSQIRDIMIGNTDVLPPKYSNLAINIIKDYVKGIAETLSERGFSSELLPIVFLGGGAKVVELYGGRELFPLSTYITNIHANAIGYEKIAKSRLKKYDN